MGMNRISAGIAMTMLLLVLPAAASDYTLGIFGNANEDDTINMQDVTYTELIILEYRDRTDLADAKYDGKINMQDVTQIELIILGRELELTFIDSADKIKTVTKPIERIVTCNTNALQTMRSIKVEKERIVGVSRYAAEDTTFFPEFSDHPAIYGWVPDCEQILQLQPEVVIYYGTFFGDAYEELETKLKPVGITVIGFDFCRPTTELEEVKKLGYIFDKRDEADDFLDFYQGIMDTISESVRDISEDERPRVYFEAYQNYHSSGNVKGGYHDYIEMAGGHNIFGDIEGIEFPDVDAEEVIARNPAIIVKLPWAGGYDVDDPAGMQAIRDEIMNRPELAQVSAVTEGKVYVISSTITGTASHVIGIAYLAKWFHPELFEEMYPQAIHQEYLTEFQGLDYDLNEHGVFVYPQFEES